MARKCLIAGLDTVSSYTVHWGYLSYRRIWWCNGGEYLKYHTQFEINDNVTIFNVLPSLLSHKWVIKTPPVREIAVRILGGRVGA